MGWCSIISGIYRSIRGFAPEVMFIMIRQVGWYPEGARPWMGLRLVVR